MLEARRNPGRRRTLAAGAAALVATSALAAGCVVPSSQGNGASSASSAEASPSASYNPICQPYRIIDRTLESIGSLPLVTSPGNALKKLKAADWNAWNSIESYGGVGNTELIVMTGDNAPKPTGDQVVSVQDFAGRLGITAANYDGETGIDTNGNKAELVAGATYMLPADATQSCGETPYPN